MKKIFVTQRKMLERELEEEMLNSSNPDYLCCFSIKY